MALAHAMWIHGNTMQIEHPEHVDSVWRAGFYIRVDGKPGRDNWFHFAIPTPVIVNDYRLRAGSVLIRFKTGSVDASVRAVHVYDGERPIARHDGLNLAPRQWHTEQFDVPGNPEIRWGLGISIGVGFGVESLSHRIEFSSAGCDFLP